LGAALAGIDFCGTFAFGAGADDGVADEDDAASEAVAFGGVGAIALGSCPYPDAAALDASAARWAPSLSPMVRKTDSVTLGSRFGAMVCFHPNLPRCASCSAYVIE
jgi:hypothetical protein